MKEKPEKLNLIIGLLIILIFIAFSFLKFPIFEFIERNVYDIETVLCRPSTDKPPQIALIEIDDKSINQLGKWPWPRLFLAQMIDLLDKNGVKLIGLNIPLQSQDQNQVFDEIKAFQKKIDVYPPIQKNTGLKNWLIENLNQIIEKFDNNLILVNSVKKARKIVLPAISSIGSDKQLSSSDDPYFSKCFITSSAISNKLFEKISANEITPPFPELAQNALGFGHNILSTDDVMGVRLHPLFINYKGALFPSFPLRLAIAYLNLDTKQTIASENKLQLGGESIPLINGKMLIIFSDSKKKFLRFSFFDLLNFSNLLMKR